MTDFTVRRYGRYSQEELVAKLRDFLASHESRYVAGDAFSAAAGISQATIERAFGSWAKFCHAAGVEPRYTRQVDRDLLFKNLEDIWTRLGRQPRAKEMKQPESPISLSRYTKITGKPWHEICEDFLLWKSGVVPTEVNGISETKVPRPQRAVRTPESHRSVSLSVRYSVLTRDGFRCIRCGRSPASDRAVELHVDHVVPRSKGGSGELGNLQTLCNGCNLGKSDRHEV